MVRNSSSQQLSTSTKVDDHTFTSTSTIVQLPLIDISLEAACKQAEENGCIPTEDDAARWASMKNPYERPREIVNVYPQVSKSGELVAAPSVKAPPRPPNMFIIFRSAFESKMRGVVFCSDEGKKGMLQNGLKSRVVSFYWSRLSAEERRPWVVAAAGVKGGHGEKYPDYKYRPRKKGTVKKRRRIDEEVTTGELKTSGARVVATRGAPKRRKTSHDATSSSAVSSSSSCSESKSVSLAPLPYLIAPAPQLPLSNPRGPDDPQNIHQITSWETIDADTGVTLSQPHWQYTAAIDFSGMFNIPTHSFSPMPNLGLVPVYFNFNGQLSFDYPLL